jgi:DNA repair photolyase
MIIRYVDVSTGINRTRLPDIDYSINPYFGCRLSCIYCYAMKYLLMRGLKYDWGEYIEVKLNLPNIVKKELKRIPKGSVIGVGISTDPYQPIEAKAMITRKVLQVLSDRKDLEVSIQTKSPMVTRDIDIMKKHGNMNVGFTITTLNNNIASILEPLAPRPISRLRAVKILNNEGIFTWIFIGPILPFLTDSPGDLREIVSKAYYAGAKKIYVDNLRFRLGVRENIFLHLKEVMPDLSLKYRTMKYNNLIDRYNEAASIVKEEADKYGLEYENVGYTPNKKPNDF